MKEGQEVMGIEPTGTGGWGEVRLFMGKILDSVGLTEDKWTAGEGQGRGRGSSERRRRGALTPDLGHPDALRG